MIYKVRMLLYNRDGDEMEDLTPVKGTMEVTSEGTVLTYSAGVGPAQLRYIEFIPDISSPSTVTPERELVGA